MATDAKISETNDNKTCQTTSNALHSNGTGISLRHSFVGENTISIRVETCPQKHQWTLLESRGKVLCTNLIILPSLAYLLLSLSPTRVCLSASVSPAGAAGCDLLCKAELELSVMQLCVTLPYQPLRGYCCLTMACFPHCHTRSFHAALPSGSLCHNQETNSRTPFCKYFLQQSSSYCAMLRAGCLVITKWLWVCKRCLRPPTCPVVPLAQKGAIYIH